MNSLLASWETPAMKVAFNIHLGVSTWIDHPLQAESLESKVYQPGASS